MDNGWNPEVECRKAITRLMADGVERSQNQIQQGLQQLGDGFQRAAVLRVAKAMAGDGELVVRPGRNNALLYSAHV